MVCISCCYNSSKVEDIIQCVMFLSTSLSPLPRALSYTSSIINPRFRLGHQKGSPIIAPSPVLRSVYQSGFLFLISFRVP